jgi:hypothetical protein
MSVMEIRPGMPDLSYFKGLPAREPRLSRCRLVVDRSAGTATWEGDGRRPDRVDMEVGDGPGQLAALVRAIYPRSPYLPELSGRLLLVDGTGRVLARSMVVNQRIFEHMWPFGALDAAGLPVREERFTNTRRLQKTHPGAAPTWPFTAGYGWVVLSSMAIAALIIGVAALVVVVTGWSA